jgi:hypothetical protein
MSRFALVVAIVGSPDFSCVVGDSSQWLKKSRNLIAQAGFKDPELRSNPA